MVATVAFVGAPAVASAGPGPITPALPIATGSWNTVPLPNVTFFDGRNSYFSEVSNSFGVDAQGNVYTVPCSGSFTHDSGFGNCPISAVSDGIERYSPTTGAVAILDPSQSFVNLSSMAVDASGDVYIVMYSGTIFEISASGVETVISDSTVLNGGLTPVAIAVSPTGSVYITDSSDSSTFVKELVGNVWNTLATLPYGYTNLAIAANGTVYVVGVDESAVEQITAGGVASQIPSLADTFPEGVAVDSSGNLYVVEESSSSIVELTPQGQFFALPPSPSQTVYGHSTPDELTYAAGTLYMWDEYPYQSVAVASHPSLLYTFSPVATPQLTGVTAAAVNFSGTVTQSVTATWSGAPGPYQCTLLYGYNEPSSFTVTVTTPTCTFSGLALGVTYGISVVSLSSGSQSYPVEGFAPSATLSLLCVKNGHHRTFPGRRCPRGWRPA